MTSKEEAPKLARSRVSLQWTDSKLMTGVDSRGVPLVMGKRASKDPDWLGLKPSDLLLLAAASCSTWDLVEILEKQKQPLRSIEASCSAEQTAEVPFRFLRMHLHYKIYGEVEPDKVRRAIELSLEKYCTVVVTLKDSVEVSSGFEILP